LANYLLTGAAGFIAARTAQLLLDAGHRVVGIDDLNDAYDPALKEWRLGCLQGRSGFTFHKADIRDRAALERIVSKSGGIDAVLNLAARAGVRQSVEDPWVYFETNVTGTLNLLETCKARGVRKFLLASTSSLYGASNAMPYREDAGTDRPLSPYAASKKAAEALGYTYHYLYGIDVSVVRYFTVYGPAGRPDMSLFRFVQWIHEGRPVEVFGDGRQSRDFTYVDDIARGTIAALKPLGFEVINLGSDRPAVLADVIATIERLSGKSAERVFKPRHPADVTATWADISKARRLLGWEPKVPLEQGLENLVAWYRANRSWAKNVAT
jgi:UDP-glucuronate 4-epimerase